MQPRHRPAEVDQLLAQPLRVAGFRVALQVLAQIVAGTGQVLQLQVGQAAVAQGIVLTGGAAQLRGTPDLARDRFRLPVRVGQPRGIGGLTDIVSGPAHAASVGLVLYGIGEDGKVPASVFTEAPQPAAPVPPAVPVPDAAAGTGVAPVVVSPPPPAPAPKKDGVSFVDRLRNMFKDWM